MVARHARPAGVQGGQTAPPELEKGALGDLLVVDLSRVLAGPYATMLLADLGARVIKVERPGKGDDTRSWGPPFVGPAHQPESTYFLSANRNKESMVLDLKAPPDRQILLRLVERADVVVENFRPGVLDRLSLGHATLRETNPGLVVLSISGFGPDGPEATRPGYDQIVQGESGLMSLTGEDAEHPLRMGVPIADILTGIFGAYGVVSALHQRERTGLGQVVTASLLASSVAVHTFQGTRWLLAGEVPVAEGNHHPTVAPYGAFRCRDGMIQIAVGNDSLWQSFAPLVGLDPEDRRFVHNAERHANRERLTALIEERLSQDDVQSWMSRLGRLGVPAGEIKTLDRVYASEQVAAQGLVMELDHPTVGPIRLPGSPVRLAQGMRSSHAAPPTLGEHTSLLRGWLGDLSQNGAAGSGVDRPSVSGLTPAHELLAAVVDPESFIPWNEEILAGDPLGWPDAVPYTERLTRASRESGSSESVITGAATLDGHQVAVIVSEYGFIAGTMGVAAGDRIAGALEQATSRGLPVVALAASGGARMQEGPLALAQMAKTASAVRRYREAGGCLIVYLRHPTMGGVLASWASLGSFTFAMPDALLGYTGPRVISSLLGEALAPGVQRAETLLGSGLLDEIVHIEG
ncbi:MAG: CoA transferase, partial [Acidimicrobiales bacterium]